MSEPFDAIYENGAFRPINPSDSQFCDGDRVRLIVDAANTEGGDVTPDILALAAKVYSGLSASEVDEVQCIATDRSRFFSSEDR